MRSGIVIASAVLASAGSAGAQQVGVALNPGETLLEVQAEGQSRVRPDAAFISAGVVSTGTTAKEATDANAVAMTQVIGAIRKAGVDERYVRTQQITVEPRFARADPNDWQGQAQITGYVARNSVSVTVVKLANAPAVIAAAFAAGANSVNGPNLGNEVEDVGLADARSDALANARAEADAYAAGLNMKVSRVLRVSERGRSIAPLQYVTVTGARVAPGAPPPPPPPPSPIAGGEMRRSVSVWIDYALIPR